LEGIVLHAFEGQSPFDKETQARINTLKEVYNMDYDASASHRFVEQSLMPGENPGKLIVVSLWTNNLPETVHFYRDQIGLELLPHHGDRPAFSLGARAHLVICQGDPGPDRANMDDRFPLIALRVEDLDATIDHLKTHCVEIPWGIESSPDSRWIMLYDPAGNLIELAQLTD